MKKLGLDASTTTVGYAFVDGKEIVTLGFIPIQKEETIRDKVELTMKEITKVCLLYTSPSPRDRTRSRMPSSA